MSRSKVKLVKGVGINDADYQVQPSLNGKRLPMCPFYRVWVNMLERCYSEKLHQKKPTYMGCSIHPDWVYFTNFRAWMESQSWEGNQLDKDLLKEGNKVYSPDTCVFVSGAVNRFLQTGKPLDANFKGITWREGLKKYVAQVGGIGKRNIYIGVFSTAEEAHKAYVLKKYELAVELASMQNDSRIADALIRRYEVRLNETN